jgi:hypothetical protein
MKVRAMKILPSARKHYASQNITDEDEEFYF